MPDSNLIIREAEPGDILRLSELMTELGYPTTPDDMKLRFDNIQNHKDFKTFVATIDAHVSGMVGMTKNYSYEQNTIYVRVLALVTGSEFRQMGIGNRLMEAAESWASEIGAYAVLLNCGNREERKIAQQFYRKMGYEVKSSGYVKKL